MTFYLQAFDVKENTAGEATSASGTNFGFGAKFSIKFNMTKTGNFVGADGKDIKENGKTKPIQFTFRGDDDVWVFIDDTLVLDVGGAHVANSASINFSTTDGTNALTPAVTTDTARANGSTIKRADTDKSFYYNDPTMETGCEEATYTLKSKLGSAKFTELYSNSSVEHTLTVFYLERGTRESNCKITFNFQNPDTLTVVNKMSTSGVNPSLKTAAQAVADKEGVGFRIQSNGTTNSIDSPDANVNTDAELEEDFSDGSGTATTYSLTFQDDDGTEIAALAQTGIKPGTSVKLPDTAQSVQSSHTGKYIAGWKLVTGGTVSSRVYRTYTVNSNATFRAVWENHASTSSASSAPKAPSINVIEKDSGIPEIHSQGGGVSNTTGNFLNATSNPPSDLYYEWGGVRYPKSSWNSGAWGSDNLNMQSGHIYSMQPDNKTNGNDNPWITDTSINVNSTIEWYSNKYNSWLNKYVALYKSLSDAYTKVSAGVSSADATTYNEIAAKYPYLVPSGATGDAINATEDDMDDWIEDLDDITQISVTSTTTEFIGSDTVSFYVYSNSTPSVSVDGIGTLTNGSNGYSCVAAFNNASELPSGSDNTSYPYSNYYLVTVPAYVRTTTTYSDSTSTAEDNPAEISINGSTALTSEEIDDLNNAYSNYCYYVPETKWEEIARMPTEYSYSAEMVTFYVYSPSGTPTVSVANCTIYDLNEPAAMTVTQQDSGSSLSINSSVHSITDYYEVKVPQYIVRTVGSQKTNYKTEISVNGGETFNSTMATTQTTNNNCYDVNKGAWRPTYKELPSAFTYSDEKVLFWVFNADKSASASVQYKDVDEEDTTMHTDALTGNSTHTTAKINYIIPVEVPKTVTATYSNGDTETRNVRVWVQYQGGYTQSFTTNQIGTDAAYCFLTTGTDVSLKDVDPGLYKLVTVFRDYGGELYVYKTDEYPSTEFAWGHWHTRESTTVSGTTYYYSYVPYIDGLHYMYNNWDAEKPELQNRDQIFYNYSALVDTSNNTELFEKTATYDALSVNNPSALPSSGSGGASGDAGEYGPGQFIGNSNGTYQDATNTNFRLYNGTNPDADDALYVVRRTGSGDNGKFYLHGGYSARFTNQFSRKSGLKIAETGDSFLYDEKYITHVETGYPKTVDGFTKTMMGNASDTSKGLYNRYTTTWTLTDKKEGQVKSKRNDYNVYEHETSGTADYTISSGSTNKYYNGTNTTFSGVGAIDFDNILAEADSKTGIHLTATFTNTVITGDLYIKKIIESAAVDAIASYRGGGHSDYDKEFTFEVTFDDIFGGETDAYEYKTANDVFYIKDTAGYYYGTNGNKYLRTSTTLSDGVKVHKYKLNGEGDEIDEETATVARTANSGMKIKMSESVNGKTNGAMEGTNLYDSAVVKMIVIEDIPVDTKYTIKEILPTRTGSEPKLSLNSVTYFDSKSDGTTWNTDKTGDLTYTQVGSTDAYTTDNSDNITKAKMTAAVNGDPISQNTGAIANYYNIAKRNLSSLVTLNGADTRVDLVVGLGQAYLIIGKKANHLYYNDNETDAETKADSDNVAGLQGTGLTVGGKPATTTDANGYQQATDAEQTFIFKIDEYDNPSGSVSRTFYETISFGSGDAVNTYKYRVIDADSSHKYVVTEVTDWSWKYTGSAVSAEPNGNSFSGEEATVTVLTGTYTVTPIGGSETEYSNAAKVEFNNTKNSATRNVEGDTSVVENTAQRISGGFDPNDPPIIFP